MRARLEPVDVLRGAVMAVMALDHVREFFGVTSINPTDLATTTPLLFFTRWITHICAPVFCLLSGTGAFLALRRRSKPELVRFLLARGLWLIVLEIVVARCFAFQFNFDYRLTMLTVLWMLGWSMIVLAFLVPLPPPVITAFGVAMIAAHNLFDPIRASFFGALAPLWTVLHAPGLVVSDPRHLVFAAYPLVPWVGVAAVGYGLGQLYELPAERRRALLWRLGIGLTVGFVLLRAANGYGDPRAWTPQRSTAFTVLSFLNTNKYPPSLQFLLMTLGPALCMLAAIDRRTPGWLRPLLVFGRVPLFYYLVHLTFIHLLAVAVCYVRYGDAHWMFESARLDQYPFTPPPGWGFGLPIVYLTWVGVVATLYPLCRWFAGVKQRRDEAWLSYL